MGYEAKRRAETSVQFRIRTNPGIESVAEWGVDSALPEFAGDDPGRRRDRAHPGAAGNRGPDELPRCGWPTAVVAAPLALPPRHALISAALVRAVGDAVAVDPSRLFGHASRPDPADRAVELKTRADVAGLPHTAPPSPVDGRRERSPCLLSSESEWIRTQDARSPAADITPHVSSRATVGHILLETRRN